MNENLVAEFIEKERYKKQSDITEENLIEANIKLVDENKWLKKELEIYKSRNTKAIEIIEKPYEYTAQLIIRLELVKNILKGDEYEK